MSAKNAAESSAMALVTRRAPRRLSEPSPPAPACGCLARRTTSVENLRANVAARDAAVERDAILEREGRERAGRGRARPCAGV